MVPVSSVPTTPRRFLHERLPATDEFDVALGHVMRPMWRGRVHLLALQVAVPAMVALFIVSEGLRSRVGIAVYAAGLCSMLAVSVTYHRWVHGLRARSAWRRADHATIFAAIAGSTTPIALVVMSGAAAVVLLVAVWSLALAGAVSKLSAWSRGDVVGSALYAAVSAMGALALPAVWVRHGPGATLLVVVGGVIYIVGAAMFSRRWPRLRPAVFSYHELWHVCTVVAAGAHFAAIWLIVT